MSCRVYLVRHGETEWNALSKFQGHADISLTHRGREQARALGLRLQDQDFAAVYSSDLGRAVETAQLLAAPHSREVISMPALREINFGHWEGLDISQIKESYGQALKDWWASPLEARVPGGERLSEVVDRVVAAIKNMVEMHQNQHILVVCHGGPIRCIVGRVLGMDLNEYWRLRQDNVSLNVIDFPTWERGILMLFNDCSHLDDCLKSR